MKAYLLILRLFIILSVFVVGCGKGGETPDPTPNPVPTPDPLTITVDTDIRYQTIAGFGGANRMWGTQFLKPAEAQKAFGTGDNELGLSIFRVRIASNPNEWPLILESVQEAQSRGIKILASPWSPPASLKSNNSDIGGYLLPENYGAYKDHINAFIQYMADNGVEIYAISIQNEPDIQVSYESCDWTTSQMVNFLKDFGQLIEGAKVAAPESFNFNPNFTNTILNNAEAVGNLDIVAGHIYGGGLGGFPLAEQTGKEVWMTEYLMNLNTGNSGAPAWTTYTENEIWDETMEMLLTVHEAMSYDWNAYIWWYLQRYYSFIGDGDEGTTDGEILKRGYAFSQFSKFVRPGYVRVDQSSNKANNLEITAYEGTDQVVVVIINPEGSSVSNLNISAPSVSSASAYRTSVQANMESVNAEIADGKVVLDITAKSITTIVVDK